MRRLLSPPAEQVPNILGLLLFAVQITVYRLYSPFCGPVSDEDLTDKHNEVLVSPVADHPQEHLLPADTTVKPVVD